MKHRSKNVPPCMSLLAALLVTLLAITTLLLVAGCGGGATEPSASPSSATSSAPSVSPSIAGSPAVSVSPTPAASSTLSVTVSPTPAATISSELGAKAKRLVAKLFALVQDKKYAAARALITSPDKVWALSDMKRIKRIRLIGAQLLQTGTPHLIVLLTHVERSPKTVTGVSDWPNFVTVAVDPVTGEMKIVEFTTGP